MPPGKIVYSFFAAILGAIFIFPGSAAPAPSDLRVNLLEFPQRTTIPSRAPSFGWVFYPNVPGRAQSAYQVVVSSSESQALAGNGDRWNSGRVGSAESLNIPYGGNALSPGGTYYWRVRTWSGGADSTDWSAVQAFTVDDAIREAPLFAPNANQLVWIWYPESTNPANASRYFRRMFTTNPAKTVTAAQLIITTDNSCVAYVNGTLVANSTNWKVFTVANVTSQVVNGTNVLAVSAFNVSEAAGLTGKVQLRYADGTEETVPVDASTKASLGNPSGWTAVNFNDASWVAAKSLGNYGVAPWNTTATFPGPADKGAIINASANLWSGRYQPAFETRTPPVKVEQISSGRFFIDFGKDAFGYLTVRLNGAFSGKTLTVRMGESASGSSVNTAPGGTIRYKQTTVSLANGHQTYKVQPSSTSAGVDLSWSGGVMPFRYVELINCPATVTAADVRQIALHTPFDPAASSFSSSNPTLNAVWELCKHSMKATSFAGVYVDGDRERKPYEADAYINQLSHYAVDAEFAIGRYSLEYLLRHSTWPTEWKLHFPLMAWVDYLYTGNKDALEANYDLIVSHVNQYSAGIRADGLLVHSTDNIVDWPAGERDGYELTSVNTVVNAFYYKSWRLLAQIATVLGKTEDAAAFTAKADRLRLAFNAVLWNSANGAYQDGETSPHLSAHASFFAMALGLVPADRVAPVMSFLKTKRMAPSVYGAQYLLEALFDGGEEDYAIGLMTDTDTTYKRNWWNMIAAGSTITMEAWDNGFKPNQDWNHAWGAAPGNVLSRYVLGLKPLTPGFGKAEIRPQLGTGNGAQGLSQAAGTIPTIRGPVSIAVQNSPTTFQVEFTLPGNMTADVVIPTKGLASPVAIVDGQPRSATPQNGRLVIKDVSSGSHTIALGNAPPSASRRGSW